MQGNKSISLYIGSVLVGMLLLLMMISFLWTPYDPNYMNPDQALLPPSFLHLFGTDNFGRDLFSRILEGAKTAFMIGITSMAIALTFGFTIGAVSGYFGGWLDEVLMRVIDAILAIPGILFAIMLVSIFSMGIENTVLALGVMGIPSFARIVRSGFAQVKELDFVTSVKVKGASPLRIMMLHILPNIVSQIMVAATLFFSSAILAESGLSYLGLGVQPPDSSWGRMLNEAQPYLANAPWYMLVTGVFITLLVLGFNLLGDGLRDLSENKY